MCTLFCSVSIEKVKMAPQRRKSVAQKIALPRISHDETSQSSQNSKTRAKNYSAEECQALIKCCDKFHTIINDNLSPKIRTVTKINKKNRRRGKKSKMISMNIVNPKEFT